MEEETKVETTTSPTEETAPSQKSPIDEELERIETSKRSKLEKLEYTRERVEKQIQEEKAKAGIVDDEDKPLTVREFKALQQDQARETALNLAESIENESERKLVKHHLENTIRPSGDPQADLSTALAIVQGVKNKQIAEEALRATKPRTVTTGAGAPPREVPNDELTPVEEKYRVSFKLTKEQVIAARPKE